MDRVIVLTLALLSAAAIACADAEESPASDSLPSAAASPLPVTGTGPSPIITRVIPTPVPASPQPPVVIQGPVVYVNQTLGYSYDVPANFFVQGEAEYSAVTSYDPRTAREVGPGFGPTEGRVLRDSRLSGRHNRRMDNGKQI